MGITALVHIIGSLIVLGYAQNYYFHLRMLKALGLHGEIALELTVLSGHHKNNAH